MTPPNQDAREARRWSEQVARRAERHERQFAETLVREQAKRDESGKPGPSDLSDVAQEVGEALRKLDEYHELHTTTSTSVETAGHHGHDVSVENLHHDQLFLPAAVGIAVICQILVDVADVVNEMDVVEDLAASVAQVWNEAKAQIAQVIDDVQREMGARELTEPDKQDRLQVTERDRLQVTEQNSPQVMEQDSPQHGGSQEEEKKNEAIQQLLGEQANAMADLTARLDAMEKGYRTAHRDDPPEKQHADERKLGEARQGALDAKVAEQAEERRRLEAKPAPEQAAPTHVL